MDIPYTTAKGKAVFPHLNTPDTNLEYNPNGPRYKTSLSVLYEDAKEHIDLIKEFFVAQFDLRKQLDLSKWTAGGKKKVKKPEYGKNIMPYRWELDDDAEKTGNVIFSFKCKEQYKPNIYDSRGKLLKDPPEIYGGSILRVSCSGGFFCSSKEVGQGVTLYLRAIQIIELSSGTYDDSTYYGFDEEEGGYIGDCVAEEGSPDLVEEEEDTFPSDSPAKPKAKGNSEAESDENSWSSDVDDSSSNDKLNDEISSIMDDGF